MLVCCLAGHTTWIVTSHIPCPSSTCGMIVYSRFFLNSPGKNISSMVWRTKSWLNVSLMTLLEWVFLTFPGKLKEMLSLFFMQWHSFNNVHWGDHCRPGSMINTEGVRMNNKSASVQLRSLHSVWDIVTMLAMINFRIDSLAFRGLFLCWSTSIFLAQSTECWS